MSLPVAKLGIKIALRWPTAHKIGKKETRITYKISSMFPFDASLTVGEQVSLLDFSDPLKG